MAKLPGCLAASVQKLTKIADIPLGVDEIKLDFVYKKLAVRLMVKKTPIKHIDTVKATAETKTQQIPQTN